MSDPFDPAALVLGPALRRVDGARATIWVQTGRPGTVQVRAGQAGGASPTFTAYGRHYALVVVDGLPPAAVTAYQVFLDGVLAWPPPGYTFAPPAIHTRAAGAPTRLVFGSCRESTQDVMTRHGPDALDSYAIRLSASLRDDATGVVAWPDSLVLLGDQVYADKPSPAVQGWLDRRRLRRRPDAPATEVVTFSEYTHLYLESWTDPEVRWLLSTVPSAMIFDDHEIIDDWNTSEAWRADQRRHSWWAERIAAGLASYWIYQHLGNLSPEEVDKDPTYQAVQATEDATEALAGFGARADADRDWYRWSFALDVGRTRLVVLDNRAGRELEPGQRRMLPAGQWQWLVDAVRGDYDHLVIGSSLPWLMPPAIHHIEAMNERLCDSRRRWVAASGERVRRALDLEHWAAFGRSFNQLGRLLAEVGAAPGAPATISVISGDVHHSYVARASLGDDVASTVYQLVCSPMHNALPRIMQVATRFAWTRVADAVAGGLAALVETQPPGMVWRRTAGPFFGNALSTLVHDGRTAYVTFESTDTQALLRPLGRVELDAG